MPNTILSPNMGLPIPITSTDPGPDYANNLNTSLLSIDQHNHSTGQGVPVNPSGILINSDLSFNNFNITNPRTVRLYPQAGTWTPDASDVDCLLTQNVDLYYIDGNGKQIRMTQSGSVAGSAGTITGLPSGTASAAYGAGSFVFQSATNTAASISGSSFLLHNNTAGSFALTLSPPTAMASNFTLTLPSLPVSQSFLTLDASGNIGAPTEYPLTTAGIANSAVTNSQLAAPNTVTSSSSGSYSHTNAYPPVAVPGMSVSITCHGQPIFLSIQPADGITGSMYVGGYTTGNECYQEFFISIYRDGVLLTQQDNQLTVQVVGTSGQVFVYGPASTGYVFVDTGMTGSAGSPVAHTYAVYAYAPYATYYIENMVIRAVEL